jgi:aminoglycoside phosphotransferase family enzyme/predicted kinase
LIHIKGVCARNPCTKFVYRIQATGTFIMTPSTVATDSARLIAALRNPACYTHATENMNLLETHISWVILTGSHAYKIKKPVNLGFLDFTTLDARRDYCEEELRLNQRLAPYLYEAVVPITGSVDSPLMGGNGAAIEYAVKMREFPQRALASHLLADGALTTAHIDALAGCIVAFHAHTGVAARGCPYGIPEAVIAPARDNFTQIGCLLPEAVDQTRIAGLCEWTEHEYQAHWTQFHARLTDGCVRECHGDLHLGNIVMLDGKLTPFDCIEFNPALRWIDVMSEIAFLVMDLMDRGRADLANQFLNAYLEASDGYGGLAVLRFYRVYRAMVRAKVHALRATQSGTAVAGHERLVVASRGYLELAQRCAQDGQPAIILMHGLSGSGKSVLAQSLAQTLGAIRLRSDIERKRISGLAPLARSGSSLASGLYSAELTEATYHRLLDLARLSTAAGYPVIVDATFLKRWQRDVFRREADARGMPFVIVDVTAPEATLRARIAARLAAGGDASEADQLAQNEALSANELSAALRIENGQASAETIKREAAAALHSLLAAHKP